MRDFSRKLLRWYKKNKRPLPWRGERDPYKIWISEIMLQQTTVSAVRPYYQRWIAMFPDIDSVARAKEQRILKAWQGLGYYQRARNLHKTAKILVKEHGSQLPRDPSVLKFLPGFGEYTVAAVASIAFNRRLAVIDANVRRVVMRLLAIEGHADIRHDQRIRSFLESHMPVKKPGDFNQAMMELGALVCRSREPICNRCPLHGDCRAYQRSAQEIIPRPKNRTTQKVNVAIGVVCRDGKYLIQRRPDKGLLSGMWEFPGGKIEPGEDARAALFREIKEELGVEVAEARFFMAAKHFYTQFEVRLSVWLCQLKVQPGRASHRKWVPLNRLSDYPMPSGSAKILDKLLAK